ncbi:MAG TPA: cytochrome P450 [Mycobacteriales bacterium]|nr:cytochrome P450 [Mycobacteriales bacterium]
MTGTCPVRPDFDPLGAEFLADPFAVLAAVREQPVFYAPSLDYYVVTRHADIAAVFRDTGTYSAAAAQLPLVALEPEAGRILLDGGHRPQPSMVSLDQPEHTRLRRPATRAFTAARVQAMAPEITARVDALLDAVADAPAFDLVEALCFPLPADTIFSLMGVPREDYPQLRAWCGSRAALAWGRPAPEEQIDIATNMVAYRRYLRDLVDTKAGTPGDDFTSDLLVIHREDPDKLGLDEIASILFSLSFAGHETTNNLIGNTVRRLLEDPSRWARIVADPALAPGAVEETLRYDPSVPVWRRITTRPTTLSGVELPAGAKLFLWLAAAGRDTDVWPDADRFELDRPDARAHLAFGGRSIHLCLGAGLGRLEAAIAVQRLATRFPHLSMPAQQIPFHPNISFRGPQRLLVETG